MERERKILTIIISAKVVAARLEIGGHKGDRLEVCSAGLNARGMLRPIVFAPRKTCRIVRIGFWIQKREK